MTQTVSYRNDDEAAHAWLGVLRDGTDAQKIQAREQLAAIFERKGMLEEATDLLVSNVREGVRNADIFRWMARLYRARGDEVTAMQAAAEAAKYLPDVEPVVATQAMTPGTPPPQPVYVARQSSSGLAGCFKAILILVAVTVGSVIGLAVVGAIIGSVSGSTPSTPVATRTSVVSRTVRCDLILWHDHQEMLAVALRAGREGSSIVPAAATNALAGGRASVLPSGTRVRVTGDQGSVPEARLEVADGPYAGRAGWTTRPECLAA